jgi:hypothetical protein
MAVVVKRGRKCLMWVQGLQLYLDHWAIFYFVEKWVENFFLFSFIVVSSFAAVVS